MVDLSSTNKELLEEVITLRKKSQELEKSEAEHKQAERRLYLGAEIFGILNEQLVLADTIKNILAAIKRETGFDAVGIRLRSGDDFPYFVQNGFSQDFLLTENTLIARDKNSVPCRDKNGNISLECTCGLVLTGPTDPQSPLFTEHGSIWTNDSSSFLTLPAKQDPRLHPRNNCVHQGYFSLALMPIRANREIVGLLQLNDRKKDCFTSGIILFFEGIAASIGVALMRKQAAEERERLVAELQKALSEVKTLRGYIPICASCKKIRDDKGYWNQVESYIERHTEAEFSHGICPDCLKRLYPEYAGEVEA